VDFAAAPARPAGIVATPEEAVPAVEPTEAAGSATVGVPQATATAHRTAAGKGAHPKRAPRRRAECMASTGEVRAVGPDRYRVERDMLDRYLRDAEAAEKLGSATWHEDASGDVDGIRVLRVRCGSPLAEAGLARGDVVKSASGRDLDSMAGLLALWWRLRTEDIVTLEVVRAGQRRTLTYELV
jgi:S1-C subfamily serine protease